MEENSVQGGYHEKIYLGWGFMRKSPILRKNIIKFWRFGPFFLRTHIEYLGCRHIISFNKTNKSVHKFNFLIGLNNPQKGGLHNLLKSLKGVSVFG